MRRHPIESFRLHLPGHDTVCRTLLTYTGYMGRILLHVPTVKASSFPSEKRYFATLKKLPIYKQSSSSTVGIPVYLVSSVGHTRTALQWILAFCATHSTKPEISATLHRSPGRQTEATQISARQSPSAGCAEPGEDKPVATASRGVAQASPLLQAAVADAFSGATSAATATTNSLLAAQRQEGKETGYKRLFAYPFSLPDLPLVCSLPFTRGTRELLLQCLYADAVPSPSSDKSSAVSHTGPSSSSLSSVSAVTPTAEIHTSSRTCIFRKRLSFVASGVPQSVAADVSLPTAVPGPQTSAADAFAHANTVGAASQALTAGRFPAPLSRIPCLDPPAATTSPASSVSNIPRTSLRFPSSSYAVNVPLSSLSPSSSFPAAAETPEPVASTSISTPLGVDASALSRDSIKEPLATGRVIIHPAFGRPDIHYTDVLSSEADSNNSQSTFSSSSTFRPSLSSSASFSFLSSSSSSSSSSSFSSPDFHSEACPSGRVCTLSPPSRFLRSALGVYVHPACSPVPPLSHPLSSFTSSCPSSHPHFPLNSSLLSSLFDIPSECSHSAMQMPTLSREGVSTAIPLVEETAREIEKNESEYAEDEQVSNICFPVLKTDMKKAVAAADALSFASLQAAERKEFISPSSPLLGRFGCLSTLILTTPVALFFVVFPPFSSLSSKTLSVASYKESLVRSAPPSACSTRSSSSTSLHSGTAGASSSTAAALSHSLSVSSLPPVPAELAITASSTEHEAMAALLGIFLFENENIKKIFHDGSALLSTLLWQYNIRCRNIIDLDAAATLLLDRDSAAAAQEVGCRSSLTSLLTWRCPAVARKLHTLQLKMHQQQQLTKQQQQQQQVQQQHYTQQQRWREREETENDVLHQPEQLQAEQQQDIHFFVQETTPQLRKAENERMRQNKEEEHQNLERWREEQRQMAVDRYVLRLYMLLKSREYHQWLVYESLMAAHVLPLLLDICLSLNDPEAEFARERTACTTVRAASLNTFLSTKPLLSTAALRVAAVAAEKLLQQEQLSPGGVQSTQTVAQQQTTEEIGRNSGNDRDGGRRRRKSTKRGSNSDVSSIISSSDSRESDNSSTLTDSNSTRTESSSIGKDRHSVHSSSISKEGGTQGYNNLRRELKDSRTVVALQQQDEAVAAAVKSEGAIKADNAAGHFSISTATTQISMTVAQRKSEDVEARTAAQVEKKQKQSSAAEEEETDGKTQAAAEVGVAGCFEEKRGEDLIEDRLDIPTEMLLMLREKWNTFLAAAPAASTDNIQEGERGTPVMELQTGLELEAMLLQRATGDLLLFDINCGFHIGVASGAAAARPFADMLPGDVTRCCVAGRSACGRYIFLQRVGGDQLVYDLRSKSMLPLPSAPESSLLPLSSSAPAASLAAGSMRGAGAAAAPIFAAPAAGEFAAPGQNWNPIKLTSNASLVNSTSGFTVGLDEKFKRPPAAGSSERRSINDNRRQRTSGWDNDGKPKPYIGQKIRVPGKRGAIKIRKRLPRTIYDDDGRNT